MQPFRELEGRDSHNLKTSGTSSSSIKLRKIDVESRASSLDAGARGALSHLDNEIKKKSLADLHTHLLGMGDSKFWIDLVIKQVIPTLYNAAIEAEQAGRCPVEYYIGEDQQTCPSHANWFQVERNTKAFYARDMVNKLTLDVVYKVDTLCVAFGVKLDDTATLEAKIEALQAKLMPRVPLKRLVKERTVFNARDQKFETRTGITNTDVLNQLLKTNAQRTLWANGFVMDAARDWDRHESFMKQFTPQFYPRRYILKDDIYEQYPDVLDVLLLHALDRYRQAGVSYVEFSVGHGDLVKRPWIFKHLSRPSIPPELQEVTESKSSNQRIMFTNSIQIWTQLVLTSAI